MEGPKHVLLLQAPKYFIVSVEKNPILAFGCVCVSHLAMNQLQGETFNVYISMYFCDLALWCTKPVGYMLRCTACQPLGLSRPTGALNTSLCPKVVIAVGENVEESRLRKH